MEDRGGSASEEVHVFCGACGRREFDLAIERSVRFSIDDIPEWYRTGAAVVERACPCCGVLATCRVPLRSGAPVEDGHHGPWKCGRCGTSLAFVDGATGKVKAWCRRCHGGVTVSARNAFFGHLRSIDDTRSPCVADALDDIPF